MRKTLCMQLIMDISTDNLNHSNAILDERLATGTKQQYASNILHSDECVSRFQADFVVEDDSVETNKTVNTIVFLPML